MPPLTDDLNRRIEKLEKAVENGRFLRKDIFDIVVHDLRDEHMRIAEELGAIRSDQKAERVARENDRKGLRNLIFAAILSASLSLIVSIIIASTFP